MTLDQFTGDFGRRLGTLTGEQLQAAVDRFDLGKLVDATSVIGGKFGQNVLLTTTTGSWVLRGCPHFVWQFPKERYFARLIAARTNVPAPWPYLIEASSGLFGWSYALMPRLPGLQLADPSVFRGLSADDQAAIARGLGEGLARLHELSWPYGGTFDVAQAGIVRFARPHRETVLTELDEFAARCTSAELLTDADLRWVREIVEPTAAALDVPFDPTFVHHDFTESNVVVHRGETGWRVTGVFDLMEAYFGDAAEDVVRPVFVYLSHRPRLAPEFIRGYAASKPLREGADERFRVYMLRDCLLIWEFGHRPSQDWLASEPQFRTWAERYVRLDVAATLA